MKKVTSYEHACEILKRDPEAKIDVSKIRVRDQKAFMSLFELTVIIEANNFINNQFTVDWANWNQYKYSVWADVVEDKKKPSGFGLSCGGFDRTHSGTFVGVRLISGAREQSKYIFEDFKEKYEDWFLIQK